MNKVIIAILVLAVVLVGGFFITRDSGGNDSPSALPPPSPIPTPPPIPNEPGTPTPSPEPVSPSPQGPIAHTVRYLDSGYSPATIEINAGDTVAFKNESTDTVWTASNPHPTHTTNSTFDELKASPPGGGHSFTFNQSGTWRYHNHLNPGHTGTIVVK